MNKWYYNILKKAASALLVLSVLVGTVSLSAFGETDYWDGDNTILVTVIASVDADFSVSDFPEVDCTDVFVASKKAMGDGYAYDLILKLTPSTCDDLYKAIQDVSANENVLNARRNEYAYLNSEILLNHTELSLQVGKKADIFAEELRFYNNNFEYMGIVFTADPEAFDINAAKDTFGVNFYPVTADGNYDNLDWHEYDNQSEKFAASPINKYYAVKNCGKNEAYEMVKIINTILLTDGVLTAEPYCKALPAGQIPGERWTLSGNSVKVSLSGGEATAISGRFVGQTATVTAVNVGTTVLTLSRDGTDASATAYCTITTYMKGDANSDGAYNSLDAAIMLKYCAGIDNLSQELIEECDINGDGVVDSLDAALLLKYAAGIEFELE